MGKGLPHGLDTFLSSLQGSGADGEVRGRGRSKAASRQVENQGPGKAAAKLQHGGGVVVGAVEAVEIIGVDPCGVRGGIGYANLGFAHGVTSGIVFPWADAADDKRKIRHCQVGADAGHERGEVFLVAPLSPASQTCVR